MAVERLARLNSLTIEFIPSDEFDNAEIAREIVAEFDRLNVDGQVEHEAGNLAETHALLTAEEESALFRMMNYFKSNAHSLRETLHPSRPSVRKMDRIDRDIHRAELVRDRLVLSNLRLVISIARRLSSAKIPFEDLVSDGNLILMRAVEKFDYSRGYRFSTYATHAIQRDIFRKFQRSGRDAQRFLPGSQEFLHDLSDESHAPDIDHHQYSVFNHLLELIEGELDDRERFILHARFGLGKQPESLKLRSIAEELDLSKERVRQLQNRAIGKLQQVVQWDANIFDVDADEAAPCLALAGA